MTVMRSAIFQPPREQGDSEDADRTTGPQRSVSVSSLVGPPDPQTESSMFDALPQPTLIARRTGEPLEINAAARALLGLGAGERLRSIDELHAFLEATTPFARAFAGERPAPVTVEARIDGAARALVVEAAPLMANGEPTGAVCTLRDVTDRVLDDEMGDDLLGRAAHDLRTPLTALKASAQLVGRGFDRLDPAARARTLGLLLGQVDKLSARIDDVLDAARIRRGRFDLSPEEVDVSAEVQEIVRELRATTGAPPIELTAAPASYANVDRARLHQLLVRLAFELAERTTSGAIAISVAAAPKTVEITVTSVGEVIREPKKRTARRLAGAILSRLGGGCREEGVGVVLSLPRTR